VQYLLWDRYRSRTYSDMVLAGFQRGRYSSEGQPSTTFAVPSPPHPTTPPRRGDSLFLSGGHAACECRHPTISPEAHNSRCMIEAAKTEVFLADGSTSWRKAYFHTSRGRSRASSKNCSFPNEQRIPRTKRHQQVYPRGAPAARDAPRLRSDDRGRRTLSPATITP
jgi:hypothetical protein